jgi:predicted enzyme related to lactoylglutathione lyase
MNIHYRREHRPGLYCVELRTSHWERAVRWYREALGLRVLVRVSEDGYALFEAGETRLAIIAREELGEPSQRWSLGFEVESLTEAVTRLQASGTEVERPRQSSEGFQEVLAHDPDGNLIRLFSWPGRS